MMDLLDLAQMENNTFKLNKDFFSIFDGVPQARISQAEFGKGMSIVDAMAGKTNFLASNSEARRELIANAISVNKEKVDEQFVISTENLINGKYILFGKGKKNNYILIIEG
jgi:tyrosyl-tRNA synthetase